MPIPPHTPDSTPVDSLQKLLDRPADQRLREYKYRFAQAIIFGLPVVVLECFGYALGGRDAERWVGFFQAILASWVIYVGAAGMLFEGLVRRRITGDLIVSLIAVSLYLISLASLLGLFVRGHLWLRPLFFAWSVVLIAVWTGIQRMRHRIAAA
jgi:cation transport ATPase